MASFFSRLSYSFGNEDWKSDHKALKIKPEDHILCITASGDRPLNLLVSNCKKVTSVDANPIQNYLLNLKSVALEHLNYDDFLQFIGAEECDRRWEMYKTLEQFLEPEAAKYWKKKKKLIVKGVLYQGAIERLCALASFMIKLLKGSKKVKKLMEFTTLEEQIHFVDTVWDTPRWRKAFDLVLHPKLTKSTAKDPGLYANLGPGIKASDYIYTRLNDAMHRGLVKENSLLSLVLDGKVPKEAFPPYLTKEGTGAIQEHLKKISTHTQDVVSFLEKAQDESFDCFSMSDVASYLSQDDYLRMLKGIVRTAKPKARFCLRQFMSGYNIPYELEHHFVRDHSLEKEVEKGDRCFVYRYMIGEIAK